MNEKMSFKMGVKFAVPFYMGRIFLIYCMKLEAKVNSRSYSKWVCFQLPNIHIWTVLYWSRPPGPSPL